MKSIGFRGVTAVTRMHPLETMNVCMFSHNPSQSMTEGKSSPEEKSCGDPQGAPYSSPLSDNNAPVISFYQTVALLQCL